MAHRGFRAVAPENTAPAFEEAGKAGYYGAECDVYRTADGVWVCLLYTSPNISPQAEFEKRLAEEKRLIDNMPFENEVGIREGRYDYGEFLNISKGLENCPEGVERCFKCYRLRLEETARPVSYTHLLSVFL